MKTKDYLKLQALVDGELSSGEAAAVKDWLSKDAEARAVYNELQLTRNALVANEPEVMLPESKDFHWSKIAREIERIESRPAWVRQLATPAWWIRYFSPAAATAIVAATLVLPALQSGDADVQTSAAPEASPVVFRSQTEGMTVIWLQGDENTEFANPEENR